MKISELISILAALQEQHGDLPITFWAAEYDNSVREVSTVKFEKGGNQFGWPVDSVEID